jgi:hypothetical protein
MDRGNSYKYRVHVCINTYGSKVARKVHGCRISISVAKIAEQLS